MITFPMMKNPKLDTLKKEKELGEHCIRAEGHTLGSETNIPSIGS